MNYYLCGQTGSTNRGCEAIVRSTVKILNQSSENIHLATFAPDQDKRMCQELGIDMISYSSYPTSIHRIICAGWRKFFPRSLAGTSLIQKPLFSRITKNDTCLNIGGDTYCYSRPISSISLNNYTHRKNIKNILWCCSIEKEVMRNEILSDLKKYSYIFARESITHQNLLEAGISANKVIKCCDPAFFLNMKEVPLPNNFIPHNTVGINLSEMVIKDSLPIVYENVIKLIDYILDSTDMSICLIPHVYSIEKNSNDYPILKKIYSEFDNARISIINNEYDCEQLKYIISKCRFFVGARTHSTIAAYSTEVPTLVLGYSVKSMGIAVDLFGTYENYVLPYDKLKSQESLILSFGNLMKCEKSIKQRYAIILPEYKKSLMDSVHRYIISKTTTSV